MILTRGKISHNLAVLVVKTDCPWLLVINIFVGFNAFLHSNLGIVAFEDVKKPNIFLIGTTTER